MRHTVDWLRITSDAIARVEKLLRSRVRIQAIFESDRYELRRGFGVVNDCWHGGMFLKSNSRDRVFLKLLQSEPVYVAPTVQ